MLAPLFVLDEPQYHRLEPGRAQRVRGAALALEGAPIETLTILEDGREIARTAVNVACPELAAVQLPNAAHCRFECEVAFEEGRAYEFRADGARVFVYEAFDLARMKAIAEKIAAFPLPDPQLVFATQGGSDTASYADSAVSGFFSIESFLRASGIEPREVASVLDIGCGTGRLLLGWHADNPSRKLAGVEINGELIEWNRRALGEVADWRVSQVTPPLPFDTHSFDVIQLASVFTHLPLTHQKAWLDELLRLTKPGGAVILTLHGEPYSRLLLDAPAREHLAMAGYFEAAGAAPGENAFATFHTRAFTNQLFAPFRDVHFLPRGNDPDRPRLFPIAALQDVYVLHT